MYDQMISNDRFRQELKTPRITRSLPDILSPVHASTRDRHENDHCVVSRALTHVKSSTMLVPISHHRSSASAKALPLGTPLWLAQVCKYPL